MTNSSIFLSLLRLGTDPLGLADRTLSVSAEEKVAQLWDKPGSDWWSFVGSYKKIGDPQNPSYRRLGLSIRERYFTN